jgi:hypothetical protein
MRAETKLAASAITLIMHAASDISRVSGQLPVDLSVIDKALFVSLKIIQTDVGVEVWCRHVNRFEYRHIE